MATVKRKVSKPALKTLAGELEKVKSKNKSTHTSYEYWVCFADENRKMNTAILTLNYKLETPEAMIRVERDCLKKYGNIGYRCIVNFKFLREVETEDNK